MKDLCATSLYLLLVVAFTGACHGSPAPPKVEVSISPTPTIKASTPSNPSIQQLKAVQKGDLVVITVPLPQAKLYRSFSPVLGHPRENLVELQVVDGQAVDRVFPDDVTLHYAAQPPKGSVLTTRLAIPPRPLPKLTTPLLTIDKLNYTLRVWEGPRSVKSYPVALGALPANRKYCQDMASTPEGWYAIYNLQPEATYHKAYDIDYPRAVDHLRHRLHVEKKEIEPDRAIGGEIQIHGVGVSGNWTAGCIALRNEDMDELFRDSAIAAGTRVFLHGHQFELGDQKWLLQPPATAVKRVQEALIRERLYAGTADGLLGEQTMLALGRYQWKHNLPTSCQLDHRTRTHFGI